MAGVMAMMMRFGEVTVVMMAVVTHGEGGDGGGGGDGVGNGNGDASIGERDEESGVNAAGSDTSASSGGGSRLQKLQRFNGRTIFACLCSTV